MTLRSFQTHTLLAWLASAVFVTAATVEETFSDDPLQRGWEVFGDGSLFTWNATAQHLEATWDSSRTNSYFYRRLGIVLNKRDDFSLQFDLHLSSIVGGINPNKPSTFEIAVGLFHTVSATNATFNRGTGRHSPNLVEFDYFPPADIIAATVSPAVVSSNNQFRPAFTFPLELTAGDRYRVTLIYSGQDQTLETLMMKNGAPFGPVQSVVLPGTFTDFRLDAVSVNSYSDHGDPFGSVLAQGAIDNITVTLPDPADFLITGHHGAPGWQVQLSSEIGWQYTLERSETFRSWSGVSATVSGTGDLISLDDTNLPLPSTSSFYRVEARRP